MKTVQMTLDEALVEVALDLSGRAHAAIDLPHTAVLRP